jgi:prenyltransferase beta subunit
MHAISRLILALFVCLAIAQSSRAHALTDAPELRWLIAQQNADGGYGGSAGASDIDVTIDVVSALAEGGVKPGELRSRSGRSPMQFLELRARRDVTTTLRAARLTLALLNAGRNPAAFGGRNLAAQIRSAYAPNAQRYDADRRANLLAIHALSRAGQQVPLEAIEAVKAQQLPDGGWSIDAQTAADPTTTALAVRALSAAGQAPSDASFELTVSYFKAVQNPDGGFARAWRRGPSNASATALVLQSLRTMQADPAVLSASNGNPLTALAAMRTTEGAFALNPGQGTDLLATAHASAALAVRP